MSRYAIGIGIKKSGNLVDLPGAVSGARDFVKWATSQGYTPKLLTDELGPVTFDQVFQAVSEALDSEPERLLIFFAGHGSAAVHGDFWLLSNWQQDANQVINLNFSIHHAKRHPVTQIGVFADACRSPTADAAYLMGTTMFPSSETRPVALPQVDLFHATRLGQIAQEVRPKGAQAFGIFTKLLLNALECREEEATEVRDGQHYVTSQALGKWLNGALPMESGKLPGGIVQMPEIQPTWYPTDNFYAVWPTQPTVPEVRPVIRSRKLHHLDTLGKDVARKAVAEAETRLQSLTTKITRLMSDYPQPGSEFGRFDDAELVTSTFPLNRRAARPGVLILEPTERDGLVLIRVGDALVLFNSHRDLSVRVMFSGEQVQLIQYHRGGDPAAMPDQRESGLPTSFYARLVAKAWLGERLTSAEVREIASSFITSHLYDPAQDALFAYHFENIVNQVGLPWEAGRILSLDRLLLSGTKQPETAKQDVPHLTRSWAFLPNDGDFEELRALRPGLVSSLWSTFRADFEPKLRRLVEGKRS